MGFPLPYQTPFRIKSCISFVVTHEGECTFPQFQWWTLSSQSFPITHVFTGNSARPTRNWVTTIKGIPIHFKKCWTRVLENMFFWLLNFDSNAMGPPRRLEKILLQRSHHACKLPVHYFCLRCFSWQYFPASFSSRSCSPDLQRGKGSRKGIMEERRFSILMGFRW